MSQLRSISFPSRVHPNAARVEDALNKLRLDCSSGQVSSSLFGLDELYICLDDFLNLQSTQQSLSQEITSRKAVDEILDGSVKILDICGISRDLVADIKEQVRHLLSSIRRRKGDYSSVADYTKFRKKTKKEAKRMTSALKRIIGDHIDGQDSSESDQAAVRVLREVNLSSCHVLKSLLMYLSGTASSKTRQSKWSRVSRFVFVHKVDCEEKEDEVNELATVDCWLTELWRCKNDDGSDDVEKTHRTVQKQLEALEMRIGSIEDGLDCIFRRFIKSRASLLNIISQ